MSNGELACTYACLILHDDGIPITVCLSLLSNLPPRVLIPTFVDFAASGFHCLPFIYGLFVSRFSAWNVEHSWFPRMVFPLEIWFCGAGIVEHLGFHALICCSFSLSVPCFQDLVWFCWSPFWCQTCFRPRSSVLCSWHSECRFVRVLCPLCRSVSPHKSRGVSSLFWLENWEAYSPMYGLSAGVSALLLFLWDFAWLCKECGNAKVVSQQF